MKILLFILLLIFVTPVYSQIEVVGDTLELKTNQNELALLLQYRNDPTAGAGFFKRIDSTYTENGTTAFDHPYSGSQWVRIGIVGQSVTLQNGETITNTTDGQISFGDANLLTTGTLGAGTTTVGILSSGALTASIITGTGTAIFKTNTGGSSTDSSLVFTSSTGSPLLTWYGTDGDAVSIGINTSDAMLFTGAGGGYDFTGAMDISDVLTLSTNGTKQLRLFDTDADDGQQPYWYLQNANNASKGILYLGYTNVSNGTSTDVMLVDSVSFTLGSTIGTGTKAFYAGATSLSSLSLDSAATIGVDAFTTTAGTDTVLITGALTTDIYIISGKYTAGVDQQDILQWEALADTLIVHRMAAGESALGYSWMRIKSH